MDPLRQGVDVQMWERYVDREVGMPVIVHDWFVPGVVK
jgi:hypothetical protein